MTTFIAISLSLFVGYVVGNGNRMQRESDAWIADMRRAAIASAFEPADEDGEREIGRASCRERVYVLV